MYIYIYIYAHIGFDHVFTSAKVDRDATSAYA